MNNRCLE